jgi:hypothetical protein
MYEAAFALEMTKTYPVVDAFERRMGYAIDPIKLTSAARVLACPVKANPPNWQHGRVLYAAVREYLHRVRPQEPGYLLDIGTAKGFSALCLYWAMWDGDYVGGVHSLDVIDPESRESRNTIAELDDPKSLYEVLEPWPEYQQIHFHKATGQQWLVAYSFRPNVAFVDGRHKYEVVSWEAALLAERQQSGDMAIFDDAQIAGVAKALKEQKAYELEYLEILPNRRYAIGRRK